MWHGRLIQGGRAIQEGMQADLSIDILADEKRVRQGESRKLAQPNARREHRKVVPQVGLETSVFASDPGEPRCVSTRITWLQR
jgi:hypothetical protein